MMPTIAFPRNLWKILQNRDSARWLGVFVDVSENLHLLMAERMKRAVRYSCLGLSIQFGSMSLPKLALKSPSETT
jgi:hypothetical protein